MSKANYTTVDVKSIGKVDVPTGLFIGNEWVAASNGATFETFNPATGEKLLDFAHASKEDVDKAVKAARKAFKTTWGNNLPAAERGRYINKIADLIERDAQKLAALESLNGGKGVRIARDADLGDTVACFRYYAGLADKIHGQTIDTFGKEKFAYTIYQPYGVCGQIIPWNYPILMWAWKVAPALAAGNTIVMKPSELTPLTALVLSDLIAEAGLPAGVVNTVSGLGATTGDAIARHMDINKVAFTGSVITGRRISIAAAESNLKKVTLELGGKSAAVVFDSADPEETAAWIGLGIFFNSGQDCCASSRVLVQEGIYDKVIEAIKTKAETVAIGDPQDEKTSFGPLISKGQHDKVLNYIEIGKKAGARVVTGGKKWAPGGNGYFVEPTVFADVTPDMQVNVEEIFGPVVCVSKFKTEEEGIALANDSEYGLGAAVFSNDSKQATRVARALDAGSVWVNQYGLLDNGVPFGGFKQSGHGRELGVNGVLEYVQVKSVHQNIGQTLDWPL